jgi:putative ABC transport system ATP-binding protein
MNTTDHGPVDLQDLVARALVGASQPRRPADIAHALDRSEGDVARALRDLGVPIDRFAEAPEGVADAVSASSPALARDGAGWLLLDDRRGSRVRVLRPGAAEGVWLTRGDLAGLSLRDWVLLPPAPVFPAAASGAGPLERVRALMSLEAEDLLTVVLYAVGVGLLSLATPVAVQALVNTVAFGTAVQPLVILTILLAGGLALAAGLQLMQTWVIELLRRRLFVRLVSDLSHRLPRVQAGALRGGRGPELVNRFFDIFTLEKAVSTWLGDGLGALITAAVGLAVLAFYHPALLVFDLLLGGTVVAVFLGLGRGGTKTAIKESKAKYAVAAWMEEMARHPVAFKASGAADLARRRTDALARDFLIARQAHFRVVLRQLAGALGLQVVAAAGLLGIGGWLVIARQLTLGQLVAAELIVAATVAAFAKSSKLLEAWYDLLAAVDKLGQLTDLPLEPTGEKTTGLPPGPLAASFDLGGRRVELRAGERVALSGGEGGALRSSLEGLFGIDPEGAELGAVPVADLDRTQLRERVSLLQGVEVVDGTVLDNLRFGRPGPSRAEAWTALRRVGLGAAISRLEGGLDAALAPSGSPLDPAEAGRLVLARSLAGAPDLLLVDQALDGLEAGTRDAVLDAVFDPARSRTVLVVSHDPAVLSRCDRVLTLDPAEER